MHPWTHKIGAVVTEVTLLYPIDAFVMFVKLTHSINGFRSNSTDAPTVPFRPARGQNTPAILQRMNLQVYSGIKGTVYRYIQGLKGLFTGIFWN